jgi:hypothetical protein
MERKGFLLRIEPEVLAALQQWAEEELRSLNGQIEYLLRQALLRRGKKLARPSNTTEAGADSPKVGPEPT